MNECEQIHPLLRGYLADTLSARDRRLVARHLNLCAMARKELDRLRSGPVKAPVQSASPASEPWDLKILRWLFKTPKAEPKKAPEAPARKPRVLKTESAGESRKSSSLKPLLFIAVFFGGLVFLTHFIQNAGENPVVKGVKHWMLKNGIHAFGVKTELEMVLDLTNQPQWSGNAAPAAFPYQELVTDPDHFRVYWGILQPGTALPQVDFTQSVLAVVFLGPKPTAGYAVKFKRSETYSDKTILWFDEAGPAPGSPAVMTRPWVIQVVPKPSQNPVLIQKIP